MQMVQKTELDIITLGQSFSLTHIVPESVKKPNTGKGKGKGKGNGQVGKNPRAVADVLGGKDRIRSAFRDNAVLGAMVKAQIGKWVEQARKDLGAMLNQPPSSH